MDKLKKKLFRTKARRITTYIVSIIIGIMIMLITNDISRNHYNNKIKRVPYTEFVSMVDRGEIAMIQYSRDKEFMYGVLNIPEIKNLDYEEKEKYNYKPEHKVKTIYPSYEHFKKDFLEKDIEVLREEKGFTLSDFIGVLFSMLIPALWIFMVMRSVNPLGAFKKENLIQRSDVRFKDIIGQDEILGDIQFISALIKNQTLGYKVGTKIPRGILLSGEPGTGKTLIAKAIAGEAGVPFLYVNSSSLIELFVGAGARRVRQLFEIARSEAPCIIFFDEIDSIGINRGSRNYGHSENDQTINALLQEMDGFNARDGVFIIGATNRADDLDTALVRAGRFDRQIQVNKPRDWRVRADLFNYYLHKYNTDFRTINIPALAKQVSGFTGADIEAICNEASIVAVMRGLDHINMGCLEEAIDKKVFNGNRTKRDRLKRDRDIVAYHEAGHAVMNWLCGLEITRVSIIGTTSGVGGVVFGADSESQFLTKTEIENRIKVAYAGRASEEIKFNSITTGASSDITSATELISLYITRYGFDETYGLLDLSYLTDRGITDLSLREKLSSMSSKLYQDTVDLLRQHYNKVELIANALLERETLSGNEIYSILKG